MASYETTTDLAKYVEKNLGHSVHPSAQRTEIVDHLDSAHKIVVSGGGILNADSRGRLRQRPVIFTWARSKQPKIVNLEAPIETGDVDATLGSTSITFNADPNSSASVANFFIRIGTDNEVYRIATHTGGATGATLDSTYVETSVTDSSFSLFRLQYDFGSSDIVIPISPLRLYGRNRINNRIDIVDRDEMDQRFPLYDVRKEFPRMASVIKEVGGTFTLQLNSYPDDVERLEMENIPVPTTIDTTSVDPLMPKHHRLVLGDLALHLMLINNDDKRSAVFLQKARERFEALRIENRHIKSTGDTRYGKIVLNLIRPAPVLRIGPRRD